MISLPEVLEVSVCTTAGDQVQLPADRNNTHAIDPNPYFGRVAYVMMARALADVGQA